MKIPMLPVVCEICGGAGTGTLATAAASWRMDKRCRSVVRHRDPRVCEEVLQRAENVTSSREDHS